MATSPHTLLEVAGVAKRYPGVLALDHVSLTVKAGEVVGVTGENGAGKSTLLDLLSGVASPDAGAMQLRGLGYAPRSYREATRRGVFRVFQEQALLPNLTVAENLFLTHELVLARALPLLRRRRMEAVASELLASLGLDLDVRRVTGELPLGERQALEIARAVGLSRLLRVASPLVLLDEPTTALDSSQDEGVLSLIEELRGQFAFLFVSHRLPEVMRVCDRILVLKDGQLVATTTPHQTDEPGLHALMVGRERAARHYREDLQVEPSPSAPVALSASGLVTDTGAPPVSLEVREGEILGIGGLIGSGKSRLGRAIAGVEPPLAGTVSVGDSPLGRPTLASFIRAGGAYLPGDRAAEGVIGAASVLANYRLASLRDAYGRGGILRRRRARADARRYAGRLEIRMRGIDEPLRSLSGGNQQKVVLARWLCREPRVLVVENPTAGVDTGARESIYAILRQLTEAGVAIVLVTDDLPELIGLSHRIAVMAAGVPAAVVAAPADAKPLEHELVALMTATAAKAAA